MNIDSIRMTLENCFIPSQLWAEVAHPFCAMKKAAVLIPLVITSTGVCEVWLTKRSQTVRHDKGHVCFPGGMFEESDTSSVETALREAHEEIGLEPTSVQVMGTIIPYISVRKIFVVPVVGIVDESFVPKPNFEVEVAFRLPLERFLMKERYYSSYFENQESRDTRVLHNFEDTVEGHSVCTFGMTASILIDVAVAIFKKVPAFSDHNTVFDPENPFKQQLARIAKFGNLLQQKNNMGKL